MNTVWIVLGAVFGAVVLVLLIYGIATDKKRKDALDMLGLPNIRSWKVTWPPLMLIVDTDLLAGEQRILDAVKEGARYWNMKSGLQLFAGPQDVPADGHVIPIMPAPLDFDEHEHAVAYTRYALDGEGALARAAIYLMPGWESYSDSILGRAFCHELGHCLGLAHDGIRNSVMYSAAVPDQYVITEKDAEFLRSVYTLPHVSS